MTATPRVLIPLETVPRLPVCSATACSRYSSRLSKYSKPSFIDLLASRFGNFLSFNLHIFVFFRSLPLQVAPNSPEYASEETHEYAYADRKRQVRHRIDHLPNTIQNSFPETLRLPFPALCYCHCLISLWLNLLCRLLCVLREGVPRRTSQISCPSCRDVRLLS